MAIRINGTGKNLTRSASLVDVALFSICGWAKLGTERDWYALFSLDNANDKWFQLALNDTSPTRGLTYSTSQSGITGTFATRPTNGTWFFWAMSHQADVATTGLTAYWSTGTSTFVSATDHGMTDFAPTGMFIGNDGFDDYGDSAFAHIKIWDAVLTSAEFWQEMHSIRPQRTANLHLWTPLWTASDANDYSGNGRNWTVTGSPTTEDGPPVSWGM